MGVNMSTSVQPTGQTHEVGVNELFFSTTDRRGVIELANSVFVRISRYSWEQLAGAPHNIIRHPDMPQGAFKVVWDEIEAGRPTCAYVDNLAADGSTYTVLATITPLNGGYLSVCSSPCRTDLLDVARQLYRAVRPGELAERRLGEPARLTATHGAQHLASLLQQAGFESYWDFVAMALPAEMEARAQYADGIPSRPDAQGAPAEVLRALHHMSADLQRCFTEMTQLEKVISELRAATTSTLDSVEHRQAVGQAVAEAVSAHSTFSPLKMPLQLWVDMGHEIDPLATQLTGTLQELAASCSQTRVRLALAYLHAEALGQFAAELIDGQNVSHDATAAMPELCDALMTGLAQTGEQLNRNATLATEAAEAVSDVVAILELPIGLLRDWLNRSKDRATESIEELRPLLESQVNRDQQTISGLQRLAETCERFSQPVVLSAATEASRGIQQALIQPPRRAM